MKREPDWEPCAACGRRVPEHDHPPYLHAPWCALANKGRTEAEDRVEGDPEDLHAEV